MTAQTLLLLMIIATQPAPDVKDVVAAWTERASSIDSADVELTIVRDSRYKAFGAPTSDGGWPSVRLRFDRERRQLDVSRLTVVRRDGRTQPAEPDPDRARVEFRNVLLEEELKGPQMIPFVEPATLVVDHQGTEKGHKFNPLDRLVAEAPLWSAQPLRFINPAKLALSGDDRSPMRLTEEQPSDRELELWIEPRIPHRPVRIVQRERKKPLWQIDFSWSGEESRFSTGYFVQTINGSGETLEFVEAKLGRVVTPLPSTTALGQIAHNRDQPALPDASSVQLRRAMRQAFDSIWVPVIAIAVAVLLFLARVRRKPAVS